MSDAPTPRRRLRVAVAAALGLLGAPLLHACTGFQPLYAVSATRGLQQVEVVTPQGRSAYLIKEELDSALGRTPGAAPIYRLGFEYRERRFPRGLRVDDVATRYELQLDVQYTLDEIATGRRVAQNGFNIAVTYDSADQPYAGVAAQQDGQRRAAYEVAQRIKVDLAALLAQPQLAGG